MKSARIGAIVGLLSVGFFFHAAGQEIGIVKGERDGVSFMTGGVSKGERARMESMSEDYNLKVVLATDEGAYLARLPVAIRDEDGQELLEVETNGPWLYAKLPAGRYTVTAVRKGVEKQRRLQVDEGLAVVMFHWSIE